MKYLMISMMMVAGACFAAAPAKPAAAAPAKPAAAKPAEKKYVDPNEFASYGPGTATKAGDPSAAEWQAANKDALAKATSDDELICFVRDGASARALLAKVKPNYGTDPLVASQIAAISQFVMRPGWENARGVWADALFDSFRTATDDTVRMAYLEQLRWCGNKKHALAIQVVASTSPSRAVRDFANVVVRELSR
jgi:hypothetical protein